MSPIATLQRSMRELGRIRTGTSTPGRGGKKVPQKLETFRLTSSVRELVEHAADILGGEVRPWERQFEVITGASTLDVVIPPGELVSQWMELWSGGGCVRRCTGEQNVLTMGPCECPSDPATRQALAKKGEACQHVTRLRVMLPQLPDIGVWRLESHGYNAAAELGGMADLIAIATQRGLLLPARLRLDQRSAQSYGQPRHDFAVPVLELVQTRLGDLIELPAGGMAVPQLSAGRVAILEPPRADLPATSDFRAPIDPTDDAPDRPSPDSVSTAEVSPGASSSTDDLLDGLALTDLGRDILETYARVQGEPWAILPPQDQQRTTLKVLFEGMATERVNEGVQALWGHPLPLASAAEAAALIGQVALEPPEEFRRRWILMLEAGRQGAPA